MNDSDPEFLTSFPAAMDSGRICAVAGKAQRDLHQWVQKYQGLFSAKPFDAALFNTVCMCTAFSAPWCSDAELRVANRAALWGFAVDWLIDYVAASRAEVDGIIERCVAVANGREPAVGDDLAGALADIRRELATAPAFGVLKHAWQDDLQGFLSAMAREWEWNAARSKGTTTQPTFDDYLANSDNLGFSTVFVAHWIYTSAARPVADIEKVLVASRAAQRVLRLINDLGTYERDLKWGDLNGLMLGINRAEMNQRLEELTGEFREIAHPLKAHLPRQMYYMERQLEFCAGFHEVTDYWGAL